MPNYLRDQRGGAALATVALIPPFLLTVAAIAQLALAWAAAEAVEHAAARAARTAAVQTPADRPGEPRNVVAPLGSKVLAAHHAAVHVLRPWSSEARTRVRVTIARSPTALIGGGTFDETQPIYTTVRFRLPLVMPLADRFLGEPDFSGGYSRTLEATVVRRNEGLARRPSDS